MILNCANRKVNWLPDKKNVRNESLTFEICISNFARHPLDSIVYTN